MAAHQAPLSLGFSRQEYWSGLPFPSPVHACTLRHFNHVRLCATPWTAAHQAPLSTGYSRQEYWSGLPFPSPSKFASPLVFPISQYCHSPGCSGRKFRNQLSSFISYTLFSGTYVVMEIFCICASMVATGALTVWLIWLTSWFFKV